MTLTPPMGTLQDFHVGDVINCKGATVPVDLQDKWFRIEHIDLRGTVTLSKPYHDVALTRPYRPVQP